MMIKQLLIVKPNSQWLYYIKVSSTNSVTVSAEDISLTRPSKTYSINQTKNNRYKKRENKKKQQQHQQQHSHAALTTATHFFRMMHAPISLNFLTWKKTRPLTSDYMKHTSLRLSILEFLQLYVGAGSSKRSNFTRTVGTCHLVFFFSTPDISSNKNQP